MVAEGREREFSTLCSQGAPFVIPRTALRPGTKTVRGRFVDDTKNGRVENRFVAADVAMRSWGMRVLPTVEGALWHSNGFETVAATLHESAQDARVECEQSGACFLPPPRPYWNVRMPRKRFHGRGQWCAAGSAGPSHERRVQRQDAGTCASWPAH